MLQHVPKTEIIPIKLPLENTVKHMEIQMLHTHINQRIAELASAFLVKSAPSSKPTASNVSEITPIIVMTTKRAAMLLGFTGQTISSLHKLHIKTSVYQPI
jgi:hypothetical protein